MLRILCAIKRPLSKKNSEIQAKKYDEGGFRFPGFHERRVFFEYLTMSGTALQSIILLRNKFF